MDPTEPVSQNPVHILIAEDSATQAERLKFTLEHHGYRVTCSANGRKALEMARVERPALVISDIVMPEMDGYQLCQQIKSDSKLKDLPVILVTTLADSQDVIRGLESGADNFVVKPFDEQYLLSRIQFVLLNHHKTRGDERPDAAVEIHFNGQQHTITADRRQTLNLLLSTYEAAIQRNRELSYTKNSLRSANAALETNNKELAQINRRLQVEVAERELAERQLNSLNNELVNAMKAAAAANQTKSDFLANMSHEIRTPMSAIIGYTDLILDPHQNQNDRIKYVNTIRRNGEHLLKIVNDVLDLAKIEAGKLRVENAQCYPCRVVSDVASLMRVRAAEKKLNLEITNDGPIPLTARSDEARLRQILLNLVGNAIKFTQDGSVSLRMKLEESPGTAPRLRFDIIDTGIGIAKDKLGNLFQPFFQAGSTTHQLGGTGLGLTISKRFAEMLGGYIEANSCPGKGSVFSLIIDPGPLEGVKRVTNYKEALLDEEPGVSTSPVNNLRGRVLLVDDSQDNRQLLSVYLKRAGAEVTLGENGQIGCDKALAALAAGHPFDVILMDMQMPELDGYSATAELRDKGLTGTIIALTAHAMADDRAKCLQAGCTDYLSKPVRRHDLLTTLARYLKVDDSTMNIDAGQAITSKQGPVIQRSEPSAVPPASVIRSKLTDETLRPYLNSYLDELPGRVYELETLLQQGNLDKLAIKIHDLCGTGGLYGLTPISDAAASIEIKIREHVSIESIAIPINELINIIRSVEGFEDRKLKLFPNSNNNCLPPKS